MSDTIYTKKGRPLRRTGDDLFSKSGEHVARIKRRKAYNTQGKYVGTLTGDRLIYRSTDAATMSSPFARKASVGFATVNRVGTALWGEEAPIPD